MKKALSILFLFTAFALPLSASAQLTTQQGGTGTTSAATGILYGIPGNLHLQSTTIGTGLTFSSGSLTNSGVTSIIAGTNITISGSTGAVTINSSGGGGGGSTGLATTSPWIIGQLAYVVDNGHVSSVATSSPINGTGITLSGTGSVVGGGLTITNSSPLSGLSASFPFSFSNPTISWLGLSTSSPIVSGQPLYATGVNTLASVASSTFLASIGGQAAGNYITALTGDVTASGPGSVAATIAANAVTYAKFQQVAANSLVGNPTGSTANAQAIATSSLNLLPTTILLPKGNFLVGNDLGIAQATSSIFISSLGNVGIGSTTPGSLLSIGTTAGVNFYANATSTLQKAIQAPCFSVTGSGTCLITGTSNSPFSPAANYATTGTLPAYTYSLGVITEVGNGALSVDGANPSVGQTVLVKNESGTCTSSSGGCNNGLYDVTAAGSGIAAFVLTRDAAYNSSTNVIPGIITYVISGTVNSDDFWAMTSAAPITIGTTALTYTEVSGGGSSIGSIGPTGQLQTGSTITLATSTQSFNGITAGDTIVGSGNTITWKPNWSGSLNVSGGGTGVASLASGHLLYGSGSTAMTDLGPGTAGQVLGIVAGVPAWVATSTSSSVSYWSLLNNNLFNNNTINVGIGTTTPTGLLTLMASSTLPTENLLTLADVTGASVFSVATSSSPSLGIGTTTPAAMLGVQGAGYFSGNLTGANLTATGTLSVTGQTTLASSLGGLLTGTSGVVGSVANGTAGFVLAMSGGNPTWVATSSINNGVTSIIAGTGLTGGTITTTGTIALAVPVTVANGGTGVQTFTSGQLLYGNLTNALSSVGTTSLAIGASLSNSGTLGSQIGGTASSLSINLTNANAWGALQTFSAKVGVGSTTPFAQLSVSSAAGLAANSYLFDIASTTNLDLFHVTAAGTIVTPESIAATSTAITLDWSSTPPQIDYGIGTSATTITLINATTSLQEGSRKLVWICNPPSAAAGALTWAGIEWIGTAPSQTTTAGQCDVYSFDITAATSTVASRSYKVAGTAGTGFQ